MAQRSLGRLRIKASGEVFDRNLGGGRSKFFGTLPDIKLRLLGFVVYSRLEAGTLTWPTSEPLLQVKL